MSAPHIRVAAILAGGLGTRIQGLTHAKPFLKLKGKTLLERQVQRFLDAGAEKLVVALREELLSAADRASLPQDKRIQYLLVNTPSSLHTLGEVVRAAGTDAPLLATMVDTILTPADFEGFLACLPENASSLLCTRFIDDESPLYVTAEKGRIKAIGSSKSDIVTSGMYWLAPEALKEVATALAAGTHKMRNFLNQSLEKGLAFEAHVVEKSIDLDRPEDLAQAEQFL